MTLRHPVIAVLISLCLMLGAVTEAVARSEMAGMSDLVLCGANGQRTVTLDASGHRVQHHPCTHCLAAADLALLASPKATLPPLALHLADLSLHRAPWRILASTRAPLARGPPPNGV